MRSAAAKALKIFSDVVSVTTSSPSRAPSRLPSLSPRRAGNSNQPAVFQLRIRPVAHSCVMTSAARAAAAFGLTPSELPSIYSTPGGSSKRAFREARGSFRSAATQSSRVVMQCSFGQYPANRIAAPMSRNIANLGVAYPKIPQRDRPAHPVPPARERPAQQPGPGRTGGAVALGLPAPRAGAGGRRHDPAIPGRAGRRKAGVRAGGHRPRVAGPPAS
ncbi:hypothetical protein G6F65_019035 [Rhizopus arrhizus]|nr:hypothetical protein G6F65_019035 [Rhizopus arrhizus]